MINFEGLLVLFRLSARRSSWRFDDMGDQSGKVVICTGGTTSVSALNITFRLYLNIFWVLCFNL